MIFRKLCKTCLDLLVSFLVEYMLYFTKRASFDVSPGDEIRSITKELQRTEEQLNVFSHPGWFARLVVVYPTNH